MAAESEEMTLAPSQSPLRGQLAGGESRALLPALPGLTQQMPAPDCRPWTQYPSDHNHPGVSFPIQGGVLGVTGDH